MELRRGSRANEIAREVRYGKIRFGCLYCFSTLEGEDDYGASFSVVPGRKDEEVAVYKSVVVLGRR